MHSSSTKPLRNQTPTRAEADYTRLLASVEDALRTKYHVWVFREGPLPHASLFAFLREKMPHISPDEWSDRADFGGVYVNGYPAICDQLLPVPCRIEYYEPKFLISAASSLYPTIGTQEILFSDGDLAIVYKPPHLPTMPAKEQRHFSLKYSVEALLGTTIHMPSRLDVSVAGLVVVSTSERMHAPLQRAFEERKVTKRYKLLTSIKPPSDDWICEGAIGSHPAHPVLRSVVAEGGQSAMTKFYVETDNGGKSPQRWVVNAYPVTGRTHQIRVHAAHSGIPIVGDRFYGGETADRLHLLSYEVGLTHPLSGAPLVYTLPRSYSSGWALPLKS